MRDEFPVYYMPTEEELKIIWQDCIFTFDANILLNLYRYSESTADNLLQIFEGFKDRIWLSHQATSEYHKNRLNVIYEQIKICDGFLKEYKLEDLLKKLKMSCYDQRSPLANNGEIINKLEIIESEISKSLDNKRSKYLDLFKYDRIREKLVSLFEGKIGNNYDENQLKALYKEADSRYQDLTPPGYEDKEKPSPRKYGDLIIWKQIIDKGKNDKRNIILISDDKKEDWWLRISGKTIGPRPELLGEILSQAKVKFYMYQCEQFMNFAQETLGIKDKKAIKEVQEVRKELSYNSYTTNRKQIATTQIEKEILKNIVDNQIVLGEPVPVENVKNSIYNNSRGYNDFEPAYSNIEINLAIKKLVNQHLITQELIRDAVGKPQFHLNLTSLGEEILQQKIEEEQNHADEPSNQVTYPDKEINEDDIPF